MSHDLSQLRKFVSPEIIFGAGCRHSVANYVKTFGARKVLLVSDPGVLAAGWVADIQASLEGQGIDYCLYTDVSPNPRVDEVMLGKWFPPERSITAVLSVECGSVGTVEHVAYRFRARRPDGDFLIEQQAYLTTQDDRISWLQILCSGFVPDE